MLFLDQKPSLRGYRRYRITPFFKAGFLIL